MPSGEGGTRIHGTPKQHKLTLPENGILEQPGLGWRLHPWDNLGQGFDLVSAHVLLGYVGQPSR